jgi:hypothetical protein
MEVKHTFGTGGFLDKETYDTEVACERCIKDGTKAEATSESTEEEEAPAKTDAPAKAAAPAEASAAESDKVVSTSDSRALLTKFAKSKPEEPAGVPPATASFYGPGGCVAVYTKDGTCWMQTRCQGQNISDYDFGMNCADSDGQITKHMFGKNSFDPEETFDTLVSCGNCLALDQEPAKGMTDLAITVLSLEKELDAIKTDVKSIHDSMGLGKEEKAAETTEEDAASGDDAGTTDDAAADTDGGDAPAAEADDSEDGGSQTDASMVAAEKEAESAEAREAAEAAANAAEAAATEDAEEDDDAKVFLKAHKSMKKVRHHAPHHDAPHHAVKKVHHRAQKAVKKHVHHKRVVDEDLDLDQPDMAEY